MNKILEPILRLVLLGGAAGCVSTPRRSLAVVPADGDPATLPVGVRRAMRALARFTDASDAQVTEDVTRDAAWITSNPAAALCDPARPGRIWAVCLGQADLKAVDQGLASDPVTVTVTPWPLTGWGPGSN